MSKGKVSAYVVFWRGIGGRWYPVGGAYRYLYEARCEMLRQMKVHPDYEHAVWKCSAVQCPPARARVNFRLQ